MAEPALIDGNLIQDDRPLAVEQQGVYNQAIPCAVGDVAIPAVNTAAAVVYLAAAGVRHVITGVAWSYTGQVPVGGSLIILDAGVNVFTMMIADEGCGFVIFPSPKESAAINTTMVVTLSAGGTACFGVCSVLNHWTEA